MFYIKLDENMDLVTTVREPLFRGDNLNRKLVYLIPLTVGDIDMLTAYVYLNYIRADGEPDVVVLERMEEKYNESYYQYTFPVTCRLTKYSGEVNDVFNDVFGFGSLSMSGDNVTIVGSEVTIESPSITLQTNPLGVEAYWTPGLRVDAPPDRSPNAVYQTMNEATGEWSEVKSFNEYKDGDDYIWLYARATPEKLTFDQRWQFDWDGDGVYEQLVTIKVVNAQLI
jgi:hypothetical protein